MQYYIVKTTFIIPNVETQNLFFFVQIFPLHCVNYPVLHYAIVIHFSLHFICHLADIFVQSNFQWEYTLYDFLVGKWDSTDWRDT